MKTKIALLVTVLAAALFVGGCASPFKDGLVAYYPFNGNAMDESGNGNHGEVKGVKVTKDRNNTGQAFAFGGGEYVKLPVFKYGERFTVSSWVKAAAQSEGLVFAKKTDTNMESLQIAGHKDFWLIRVYSANDVWVGRTAPRPPESFDVWKHLVVTYNGGNTSSSVKIFMDGIQIDSENDKNGIFTKFNDLDIHSEIGSQNRGRDTFKGYIDDVRIYNRALSAEEVKALYDLEKPKAK
jgi:hypothetical protein